MCRRRAERPGSVLRGSLYLLSDRPGAMTDLISGQLTMVVPAVTGQVLEFHRSGKMRLTSPKRLSGAPELPTAAEGGLPGLTVTATLGLLAPAGTPVPIVEQIAQATRKALADSAYQQMLIEGV